MVYNCMNVSFNGSQLECRCEVLKKSVYKKQSSYTYLYRSAFSNNIANPVVWFYVSDPLSKIIIIIITQWNCFQVSSLCSLQNFYICLYGKTPTNQSFLSCINSDLASLLSSLSRCPSQNSRISEDTTWGLVWFSCILVSSESLLFWLGKGDKSRLCLRYISSTNFFSPHSAKWNI